MWSPSLYWALILLVLDYFAKFMVIWGFRERQTMLIGNMFGSHFVFVSTNMENLSTPQRIVYGSSYLKSIGKTMQKQVLPRDLWQELGSLGIRKRFRSKRGIRHNQFSGFSVQSHKGYISPIDGSLTNNIAVNDLRRTKAHIPNFMVANLRSLAPKINELECVLNSICVDIACITETWLCENETPISAMSIQDFNLFCKDRGSRDGGIAAFVRARIPCVRLSNIELTNSVLECMWFHVKPFRLPRYVSTILLDVVYHPPHTTAEDNNVLYNHVQKTIDCFLLKYLEAFVCLTGDFNPSSTNTMPSVFKCLCGLMQIVSVLTRDSGIQDWFLTNFPKLI